ncbi:MAG: RidA family protein [Planctomycetota bacterium]|nr:RidA family protein [Planctomycetota bacterium]
MTSLLKLNEQGGYRFLPGIAPYSSGVVALPGFEIVHATLQTPRPWHVGLNAARRYLETGSLACRNLCAVELRCPQPYAMEGFIGFNKEYKRLLDDWNMMVDGINPVARTNVSPVVNPPTEPLLYAFSYSRLSQISRPTFVVAGGGELPDGELAERRIVRVGETSPDALIEKAECVAKIMNSRLRALGGNSELLTTIDVYTAHSLLPLLESVLESGLPAIARLGVNWFHSRPPIVDIEFEMDMRGVVREDTVDL